MAAAVFAVAEQMTDGLTSDRVFRVAGNGNVVIGITNIQGGQRPLTSIWYYGSHRWDGLQRR